MFPTKIKFSFFQRKNCHVKTGKEWALTVKLREDMWVVRTWEKKPREEELVLCKKMVIRSMEIYHNHIRNASFKMAEEQEGT